MAHRCPLVRATLLVGLFALPSGPATAGPADDLVAACWKPDAYRAVETERAGHRGGPGARLPFPGGDTAPFTPVPEAMRGSIRRVELPPGQKLLALTFDLCEANGEVSGYDGAVVDYLRENKVKATFFSSGKWLANHSERAAQLIVDPLFEIGNHSWTHRNLRKVSGKRLVAEIVGGQAAYERARKMLASRECAAAAPTAIDHAPARPSLFRFPYGTCSPEGLKAVGDSGLLAVQWDVVTGDPARNQTARRIANVVLRRARPGSIIVAHANGRGTHTAEALAQFIPALRAQGYRFVTVSELIAAGRPVIAESCYERKPGDNNGY